VKQIFANRVVVLRSASTITASAIADSVEDQVSASMAEPRERARRVEDPVSASTYAGKASARSAEDPVSAFTYASTESARSALCEEKESRCLTGASMQRGVSQRRGPVRAMLQPAVGVGGWRESL
jgi:hypothetical protein